YVDVATAQFSFRSAFDLGDVVPLLRTSAFGRSWLDLELVFALFAVAAGIAIANDRAERPRRTVAGLLSLVGALGAAAAVLLVPGLAGHASQTSPRGLSLVLDWLHVGAGAIWLGGLVGLPVLWFALGETRRTPGLAVAAGRFSPVAFGSAVVLIGSGVGASL